ncbi:MAG: GNAT family N-acetyltransferase [Oscillospiraceae bacterium]|nr:GNAT family N-acetyltransferase [Oscillospiraceae bacterium]
MYNIKIRQATASESDLNAIVHIHRKEEHVPWNNIKGCTEWTSKRLECGFYITLTEIDGNIIAYAEWVISDEPDRKFLYLGYLQVDPDYQRKGIGRIIIADGIEYAKKNNCSQIVTNPEVESGADIFYRKCGFKDGHKVCSLQILTEPYKDYKFEKTLLDKVPFSAVKGRKFIFGKWEFASSHIWQVFNEPINRKSYVISIQDGTYIQIDEGTDGGAVMIWANSENYGDIIKSALSFAYSIGYHHLDFVYFEDDERFLNGFDVYNKEQQRDFEQIYYID